MGEAAESSESQEPLQQQEPVIHNGTLESGGEPEPRCSCRKHHCKKRIITLGVVFSALLIVMIVLAVLLAKPSSAHLGLLAGPVCPDGWVGYQGKCYYFSETEGNWTYSWKNCSSFGASLAGMDSRQEMSFLLRYKGVYDHWIGLQREQGQPWKWTNGTAFNHLFLIRGAGDCAYLNDEKGVSSSWCSTERRWLCSKPEVYVTGMGLHRRET